LDDAGGLSAGNRAGWWGYTLSARRSVAEAPFPDKIRGRTYVGVAEVTAEEAAEVTLLAAELYRFTHSPQSQPTVVRAG
jgi:hypothetical protein